MCRMSPRVAAAAGANADHVVARRRLRRRQRTRAGAQLPRRSAAGGDDCAPTGNAVGVPDERGDVGLLRGKRDPGGEAAITAPRHQERGNDGRIAIDARLRRVVRSPRDDSMHQFTVDCSPEPEA